MKGRHLLGLAAGAVLVLAGTACGGSDDKKDTATQASPAATSAVVVTAAASSAAVAASAPAPAAPQAFEVKALERGNEYTFEPKDLTVRPGTIVVTLVNQGPSRSHTWNVRKQGAKDALAKIGETEVGQSAKVEFTITEEGTYEIYCARQGHADRGQRGALTVTKS